MLKDGKDDKINDEVSIVGNESLAENFDASARLVVTVDVEKYQSWLDESDFSDEQKEEFLQSLWSIVVAFVEHGFGVHPLQEICGQDGEDCTAQPKQDFDQVKSEKQNTKKRSEDLSHVDGLEVE